MPLNLSVPRVVDPKSEYTVEFECISKILIAFEDTAGLTQNQIAAKALEIAKNAFEKEGTIHTERIAKEHSYSVAVLGVDPQSANVLSTASPRPLKLKLISSQ